MYDIIWWFDCILLRFFSGSCLHRIFHISIVTMVFEKFSWEPSTFSISEVIPMAWYLDFSNHICEGSFRSPYASWFLSLGYWVGQSGEENIPLRDRDRLRSDRHEFPGFLNQRFWTFLEQLRNKPELVGSEGTRQVSTRHPRYVTPFC